MPTLLRASLVPVLLASALPLFGCSSGPLRIGTDKKADPIGSCTPPSPPLPCNATADCANYPGTTCDNGQCSCGSSSQPDAGDVDAGDAAACTPPSPPLQCSATADCANYPGTTCDNNGQCSCGGANQPPADAGHADAGHADAGDAAACTPPSPPLQCGKTADCANYPGTVCDNSLCSCGGAIPDASACTPPAQPLQCGKTADCANYPGTVCTKSLCSCP
jgi:hypothetical protein